MDFHLTAEQQALRQRARDLADGTFAGRAARWDESEEYPWDNVKDLVAGGFMGMTIPREHGGADRPILDVVLVIEEVARACGVTGRIVVEGSLGVVGAVRAYGTEAQKRRYFPWVLEGDKPAIAITEPEAGSAATDMTTSAEPTSGGFLLSGRKRYPAGAGCKRLLRAQTGRRRGAATVALGPAQGAYAPARAYALERRQFGRPIADFQGIRWKLADMEVKIDAARLMIHRAAADAGREFPDALQAAKAKTLAAETAQWVTSEALQIHGAAGYGRSLPLERMVRDARMFAIGGGTLEMMRNLIADRILPTRSDWRRRS